ncbi:MAG: hypothetical protein WBF34_05515, partial [Streptosporangiaceae bacterium]
RTAERSRPAPFACQPPDLTPELTTGGQEEQRFPTEHDNPCELVPNGLEARRSGPSWRAR